MNGVLIAGGFILGLAGSFHCIGMCGPLSLSLPVHNIGSSHKKWGALTTYQLGRVLTYTILGLLIGLAGRPLYFSSYQQTGSIIAGLLIITMALCYNKKSFHIRWPGLDSFFNIIRTSIARRIHKAHGPQDYLFLGMANGWLPCGMVYVALVSSLSASTILESIAYMTAFGAGTMPAILLIGISGYLIKPTLRHSLQKLIPYCIGGMGLLPVLRGLNLGIPYISPILPTEPTNSISCHPSKIV